MSYLPPPPKMLAACEAASGIDRAWFRANPTREYRMRLPLEGEAPEHAGMFPRVIVWRFAPDAGMRVAIYFGTRPPGHECSERMARVFFHDAVEADETAWQAFQFCRDRLDCVGGVQ